MLGTDILQESGIYTASSPTTVCSGVTNTDLNQRSPTSSGHVLAHKPSSAFERKKERVRK